MFDAAQRAGLFSNHREVARCCLTLRGPGQREFFSVLILFGFNSYAHTIFQRVSIEHAI
jgi:hypothetical protein